MVVNAEFLRDQLHVGVVADDQGNGDIPFTRLVTRQQVIEAMAHFRNENRHARCLVGNMQFPPHVQSLGNRAELHGDLGKRQREAVEVELDAHEEDVGFGVDVLVEVQDVAVIPVEELGDGRHQPGTVGARDQEDRAALHN